MELLLPTEVLCPHCGEVFMREIDTSQEAQTLVEDCEVCCRPITLNIRTVPGRVIEVTVSESGS